MRESRARATLLGAIIFSSITIWAVHFQQDQEREVKFINPYIEIHWLTWTFRICTRVFFVTMSAGERRCYKDRLNSRNPGENERYMRESRPSRSQTTVIDRKCLDTISPWAVRISLNVLSSTSYRKLKFEEYIAGEDETVSHLGLQVYSSYVHQPIEIDTEFIDLSSLHFGLSASFRVNAHDPVYRRVLRQICVADSKDLVALTQAGKIPP